MPITNWTFLIGALAMAGMIPLSGFWAKDEILVAAEDSYLVLILLLITLPITAMYMLRLYILTFTGIPRWASSHTAGASHDADTAAQADDVRVSRPAPRQVVHDLRHEPHESEPVMAWPLIVLAVPAVLAGFIVFDEVGEALGMGSGLLGAIENVFVEELHHFHIDWPLLIISTVLVGGGLLAARAIWSGDAEPARQAAERFPWAYALFRNKFYVDDFYQWNINNVVLGVAKIVAFFDRAVVNDTGVNGSGEVTSGLGFLLKFQQTGKLPNYALGMVLGVTLLAIVGFTVKG
jgi:NADH-quinone oxidoreductase subunit L